jgi:hypothetical protein
MKNINKRKSIFTTKNLLSAIVIVFMTLQFACNRSNPLTNYQGTSFKDHKYKLGAQKIPGKLQCEFYDLGGEGIAYHDSDTINSGSGGLNHADGTYLHEFRKEEAVDISYTKFREPFIDNSPYNLVDPEENALYVGWTEPGEWIKYTIDVKQKGKYQLGIMYTANKDAKISLGVNDLIAADSILIASTYLEADTIGWRQWHHWNYLDNIATLEFEKGYQTFTIHTVQSGNMNFNYINFNLYE